MWCMVFYAHMLLCGVQYFTHMLLCGVQYFTHMFLCGVRYFMHILLLQGVLVTHTVNVRLSYMIYMFSQ